MSDVVLFDGVCNLCNGSVQFVLNHEKSPHLKFASLQSTFGQAILIKHGLNSTKFDSFVLLRKGRILQKSKAALEVARLLKFPYSLAYVFILVPRFIRDFVYSMIAKNRYNWFGKQDSCWLPNPKWKQRFLD